MYTFQLFPCNSFCCGLVARYLYMYLALAHYDSRNTQLIAFFLLVLFFCVVRLDSLHCMAFSEAISFAFCFSLTRRKV